MLKKIIDMIRGRGETLDPEAILGMEGMAARNEARLAKIKEDMGEKYLLHPVHMKTRLDEPRPV